jgi:CRP-like cAMP-binding protein
MRSAIDSFIDHAVWKDTHRARLIPLGESAEITHFRADQIIFNQFHPANQFSLLSEGMIEHEARTQDNLEPWRIGRLSWRWAALGWGGFLPPQRHTTTARACADTKLLTWRHEDLATAFYADPDLAVRFFHIILDSVGRQLKWVRDSREASRSRMPIEGLLQKSANRSEPRRFAPGLMNVLRRSPFFAQFDDDVLGHLAHDATLRYVERGTQIVAQDAHVDKISILAAGNTACYFSSNSDDLCGIDRFRSITPGSIVGGIPELDGNYRAEANAIATSDCWIYELSVPSINTLLASDPEFGRTFMQRHLARCAHLLAVARIPRDTSTEERETVRIKSILSQYQARIPVTSELHKVPHLLNHNLTVANALACLNTVAETGDYAERAVARSCSDVLSGVQSELHFYRDVLDTYARVTNAPEETPTQALRKSCDESMSTAFGHLQSTIVGREHLPRASGFITIINHLNCPAYYQLPNEYHFSFDTAFVSALLSARYGESPVRVVRESPDAEYGHNLFYSRLGHITVPTHESEIENISPEALRSLRRESFEFLSRRGREVLSRGGNLLICPEGQSQPAANSPAKFYSGAFRLALEADVEPYILPIALAGFDRRYKDSLLVAVIQKPFRVSEAMATTGETDLRQFLDSYRQRFAVAVREAQELSWKAQSDVPVGDPAERRSA